MIAGISTPLLLICFLLQAVAALMAAFGIWNGRPWGAPTVAVLGVAIAVTWLIEGFPLGIVAYLYALSVALMALLICMAAALYVARRKPYVA